MSDQQSLDREAILAADDLKIEPVDVPEWGGRVFVRSLSGIQRDALDGDGLRRKKAGQSDWEHFRGRYAAACVCDEEGAALFTLSDVEALSAKSASALDRIYEKADELNGISASAMEELTKNSASARSESSGSD